MRARTALVAIGAIVLGPPVLAGCSAEDPLNEVTVIGLDYAFGGPRTLPPGPTAIAFENRGEVEHEMILVRLKEGVTLEEVIEAVRGGGDPAEFTEGGAGILIAGPGAVTASRLLVDFSPGRTYALVCNFQDEPDAPPHTALGMVATLQVSGPQELR
ncbi:MAG: hypothetical protein ACRELC_08175 [Gemmatimonadota bacterium]